MEKNTPHRILLVTGLSGAGMSTALKSLEDLGYDVIDNLPIALVEAAVANMQDSPKPLAIGIDARTRDFNAVHLQACIGRLKARPGLDVRLVLVTATDYVLQHRFSETRRRHPMAYDRSVIDGIDKERALLAPLFQTADDMIDTTEFSVSDMRRTISARFALDDAYGMMVFVTSFGFRNGLPRDADLVFDVRFMWNPHYDPALKPLTGRDEKIAKRLEQEESFHTFFHHMTAMTDDLLPRYLAEGKSYLTIAIGCTGGRHRSVFVAEKLYQWLKDKEYSIAIKHRDLEKWILEQKHRGDDVNIPTAKEASNEKDSV